MTWGRSGPSIAPVSFPTPPRPDETDAATEPTAAAVGTSPTSRSETPRPTSWRLTERGIGVSVAAGVLAVGSVLAVGLAFGPIGLVRVGVALAVVAGVVALVLVVRAAGRAIAAQRAEHAEQVRRQLKAHAVEVSTERAETMAVLDVLEGRLIAQRQHGRVLEHRVTTLRTQISGLRRELATLLPEVATLRGDRESLRSELAERESAIAELKAELARREAELVSLAEGDVLSLPRRGVGSSVPTAEQIWADGEHPSVLDLRAVGTDAAWGALRREA